MHLGRAVVSAVAAISARQQLEQLLPSSFCTPECPQCKDAVTNPFDSATLCQPNSTFIVNCGSCQTCIWTYAIENPDLPDMSTLENGVQRLLDLCLNSTANDEVVALESQVSRISELGNILTSGHTPTTTYSEITMTRTGSSGTYTITAVANPSWTTILSTAKWASSYYAEKSAESSASAAAARYNQTGADASTTITPAPLAQTTTSEPDATDSQQPLNKSWVIGPVVGSVLGLATVIAVVYLTRRKQHQDALAAKAQKDDNEDEDDSGESTQTTTQQAQLHSESMEMRELETNEVFEMPAAEPVGSELSTPRDGTMNPIEEWPLPLSPLPLLFAMTELRDEREGNNNSPKHDTYYNP